MQETEQQRKERERQEDLARLRGLRPMDDDFMRCIFKDNIPLAELVLRILLREPTLTVEKVETQRDNKRLVGVVPFLLMYTSATSRSGRKMWKSSVPIKARGSAGRGIIPA